MALLDTPEMQIAHTPDRYIIVVKGLSVKKSYRLAMSAVRQARQLAPKLSGAGAKSIQPIWGQGYFGVTMTAKHMWIQERGMSPFTMKNLAGKTIPMWIDDPTGVERIKNPKAKVRTTESGKVQVLIFRKAAKIGERKEVRRKSKVTGEWYTTTVPKHYPGAPGRIGVREANKPWTTPGRQPGAIARGNVGVWWRHPGLAPRLFLNHAMTMACQRYGILPLRIYVADAGWRSRFSQYDVE